MSYLEVFGVLTGVGVDVSKFFRVRAGVLKSKAGGESESEKSGSAHLWRKASHSSNNQHRDHTSCSLYFCLFETFIPVLFFMYITFVVNRTFKITLTERLQHSQQGWARPVEMTERGDK